jgi:hypothetical protein
MAEGTIVQFLLSQVRTAETSLVGGTAYFYAIGGTTPKAIYSDMDATTTIYSVVLDADATAEVYGTGKYRVVIKDADGVTQFDRDVNFWGGSSYAIAPATNTNHYVPKWAGTDTGTLENGFEVVTTIGVTGVDTALPTEQAVREAITGIVSAATTTTAGVAKLATNAIGLAATDTTTIVTPAVLDYVVENTPHVLQVVNYSSGALDTSTTVMVYDDSIPQNTEGKEWATLAITPKNITSKLIIDVVLHAGGSANPYRLMAALFQDTTAGALNATVTTPNNYYAAYPFNTLIIKHFMTSATISETTFKVRYGADVGTMYLNGSNAARIGGGVIISSITITEVLV